MKKFILSSLILVMCCGLVGCKKPKDPDVPPVDDVKTIEVCSEFSSETFYVGELQEVGNFYPYKSLSFI